MSETPGTNGVTVWIRRLAEISEVAGKISGGLTNVVID